MKRTCCEVFSLDTLAYWRPSAQQPPVLYAVKGMAVFLHGYLHFLCTDQGLIVTFNVSSETFGSLSLPPDFVSAEPQLITELDGCLCVCYGERGSDDDSFHVCVLRDYNKEARWEEVCCIHSTTWPESERKLLESQWMTPLRIHSNDDGKKIVFGTGSCNVFAVNPDGSAPEILLTPDKTIIGSCEDDHNPVVGLFEESLVPVGRTIEEMVLSSPTTEAWFHILKWLPTRSVLEMSLVCKEWRAIITTGDFIQAHVVHANLSKSPRIMFAYDACFGFYYDLEKFNEVQPSLYCSPPIVCSQPCHGLNVGSCGSWDFVCNLAVGYFQRIDDDSDGTFFAGRIGLGYDSESDQHVMVRITYKNKDLASRHYKLQCKMCYVNDDEWETVDPPPRPVAATPPTFVDGKIYWIVEPNLGPVSATCELVAFDVGTKKFGVLQGPPSSYDKGRMTILQLDGALCVSCSDRSSNTMDIWMMKDLNIWSLEYHIELGEFYPDYLSEKTTPLAMDPKDGRILLSSGWSLGYYDPKTAVLESIYTVGIQDDEAKLCPIICHESLVYPLGPT